MYSIIIGKFVYKELPNEELYKCFRDTVLINGATQFMIGLSIAFASYLSLAQIPAMIGEALTSMSSTPWVIFLLINIFLLILGCFVDNIAAVIILAPILLPVVQNLGMHPIQFGVILTFNLAIGFITPPYGINLFVASAISGESIEGISVAIIPFISAMIVCLLLFTYIPWFSLVLLGL